MNWSAPLQSAVCSGLPFPLARLMFCKPFATSHYLSENGFRDACMDWGGGLFGGRSRRTELQATRADADPVAGCLAHRSVRTSPRQSMYIMAVDDPWSSGGTIAKHHPDQVLSAPVASLSIVNMFFLAIGSPFVVGCAVGCSNWFRRADHGSLRLLACVGTCVGIYIANIVLFFAFWI